MWLFHLTLRRTCNADDSTDGSDRSNNFGYSDSDSWCPEPPPPPPSPGVRVRNQDESNNQQQDNGETHLHKYANETDRRDVYNLILQVYKFSNSYFPRDLPRYNEGYI